MTMSIAAKALDLANSSGARLTGLVAGSVLLVVVVFWYMWKLPRRGEALLGWAPPMALLSAWGGMISVAASMLLWIVPIPDLWVMLVFLLLCPGALAPGVLVLWIYRGYETAVETVKLQRLQAKIGITLSVIAVTLGYVFVFTHKKILTPVGM